MIIINNYLIKMHKRSSSYDINKTTSENFYSIPFQTPSSPLMQLTQNEMYSNETNNQPIPNLRKKRYRRNKQIPLRRIKQLQMNQMLTNTKLDFITKILLSQFPSFIPLEKTMLKKSSFCFSFSKKMNQKYYNDHFKAQHHDTDNDTGLFDYFNINIKPESSFVSEGEFKDKFIQPDKLLEFKFLEDTEVFNSNTNNNRNNILTNNFNKLTSNPFTQSSNKSDGELNQQQNTNVHFNMNMSPNPIIAIADPIPITIPDTNVNANRNKAELHGKGENSNMDNKELINNLKDSISISLVNYDDEIKKDMKEDKEMVEDAKEEESCNTIKDSQDMDLASNDRIANTELTVSQNTSQSNIGSSIQSGANVAKSSQDRFRKVRGFNFKNNIKTKKFSAAKIFNSEEKNLLALKITEKKANKKQDEGGSGVIEGKENEFNNGKNKKLK